MERTELRLWRQREALFALRKAIEMHFGTSLRLVQAYIYDFRRFSRHSGLRGTNTQREIESRILKEFHRIEKGLTLKEPRSWFGRETVEITVQLCEQYRQRSDADLQLVDAAYTALRQYGQHFQEDAPEWWTHQAVIVEGWLEGRHVDPNCEGGFRSRSSEISGSDSSGLALSNFMRSRSSTRNFSSEIVPNTLLRCAIDDAKRSPSVCNRQGTRIRLYSRGPETDKILKLQNLNRVFGNDASHIVIISADLSTFLIVGERNQGFVDAGMFAMTFRYSLHAQNVGTCSLNWSVGPRQDRRLHILAGIPDEEVVIMMVAVGYPETDSLVTNSPSRSIEQIDLSDVPLMTEGAFL